MAPEDSELKTVQLLTVKLNWLDACLDEKVVHWCGMQAFNHYVQGIINELVNKESMSTATKSNVHLKKEVEEIL